MLLSDFPARRVALLALLFLSACAAAPPPVVDPEAAEACVLCDAYFDARRAVVRITTPEGMGSGAVLAADGLMVTNAHVVGSAADVEIQAFDGSRFTAHVLRRDPREDLALIRVLSGGQPWRHLELEPGPPPRPGTEVFVLGHPLGLGWSITRGIVSGYRPAGDPAPVDFVQTDAAISPGNSGGPLLDHTGRLIGIVTSKLVGGGAENVAFARPAAAVQAFLSAAGERP